MAASPRFDVVVAGAGLPGLSLAAALARAGFGVVLADGRPIAAPEPEAVGFDLRVYAISPGSAQFLSCIGAWQRLPPDRVTAIEAMDIVADAGAHLEFTAYALGERALAWIVEERALRSALLETAFQAGVVMAGGMPFVGLEQAADSATLRVGGGEPVEARLIVGADGLDSWVRRAAGIKALPRPYGQTGVVANFACARAHHGVARQWFLDDGSILAWLPLPGRHFSIVWAAPDALAADLLACTPEALAERVAQAGKHVLGSLTAVSRPVGFPLSLLSLDTVVGPRLALVGDAAHGVHPLAGQGVNLGFGDARVLTDVLQDGRSLNDPGAPVLLARYARRRREPVLAMQMVTDGLARLFRPPVAWLSFVRNAGFAAVDRVPLLKRALAQPALR